MLNRKEIEEIIPQRDPFLMIDEVEDYDMEVFLAFQRVFHADDFPKIEMLQQSATELQMKHFNLFEKEAVSF